MSSPTAEMPRSSCSSESNSALQFGVQFREEAGTQQFSGRVEVPLTNLPAQIEGFVAIASSRSRSHRQQRVRNFRHGADHHVRVALPVVP